MLCPRPLCFLHRDKGVHFLETLHALAGRVAGAELPSEEEYQVHHTLVKKLPRVSP
jgi:hypothetical protein